jgi:AmmeMemoRadiSam system protein B
MRVLSLFFCCALGAQSAPWPIYFESDRLFHEAAEKADRAHTPLPQRLTGLTVPHHAPAAEMIATAFRLAAAHEYTRIVLISPDHHSRGTTLCSTTARPFLTASGEVATDAPAVARLLKHPDVSDSALFSQEHGILTVLPLVKRYFPQTPIVAIALNARSDRAEWQRMADAIEPIIDEKTLLIQSTDFSHYLTWQEAKRHDQQTLHVLATGDKDLIATLKQPAHLDSKCCQWVQAHLQQKRFGVTAPVVIDNRNVCECGASPREPRTTSYITLLWSATFVSSATLPGEAWFFGGDVFFGRAVASKMKSKEFREKIAATIQQTTSGRPLVVNLEGVLFSGHPPAHAHPLMLGMDARIALPALKTWNVPAVILANNHSADFGEKQKQFTIAQLRAHGIVPLDAGSPQELGPFRIACATDLSNQPLHSTRLIEEKHFHLWRNAPSPKPLIAWFHSGTEGSSQPDERSIQLADWAENAGASLISGCHPHVSSEQWEFRNTSLRWYSTGNLLFDQSNTNGTLLELRFFPQGTYCARIHRIGNLFNTR